MFLGTMKCACNHILCHDPFVQMCLDVYFYLMNIIFPKHSYYEYQQKTFHQEFCHRCHRPELHALDLKQLPDPCQ